MNFTSTRDCQYTQKKAKKNKSGLRDNWIERTLIESEDDDWQTRSATIPRSGSSAATGSSQPTTQPNSDNEPEGGITDDAGETEEHRKLPGKAIGLESLKSYYGGRSSASETGVSIPTIFEFAAHWSPFSPIDQRFGSYCPHHIRSHFHKAKRKYPCVAQKGRYTFL